MVGSSHDQLYLPLLGCQVSTSQPAPCLDSEKVNIVNYEIYPLDQILTFIGKRNLVMYSELCKYSVGLYSRYFWHKESN